MIDEYIEKCDISKRIEKTSENNIYLAKDYLKHILENRTNLTVFDLNNEEAYDDIKVSVFKALFSGKFSDLYFQKVLTLMHDTRIYL